MSDYENLANAIMNSGDDARSAKTKWNKEHPATIELKTNNGVLGIWSGKVRTAYQLKHGEHFDPHSMQYLDNDVIAVMFGLIPSGNKNREES